MADITKCSGKGCEMKESCYRFTVKENPEWQAYFVEPPFRLCGEDQSCENYWYNERKDSV